MKTVYESSFEEPFEYYGAITELEVPPGWVPLWIQGTEPGINHRPEYKPEHTIVRGGVQAAKITTRHASHDAVLAYSIGNLDDGKRIAFKAYAANWRDLCGHAMRIGIDPSGKIGYPNEGIVWSDWWGQDNPDWIAETYRRFSVESITEGAFVAVYLHSKSRFAANNVASYWDDVRVQVEDDAPPSGECKALSYEQTVQATKEGVLAAIREICGKL